MRLPAVLFVISTAQLVLFARDIQEVEFPVELLEADLNAIASYQTNSKEKWNAFVSWPYDRTLSVNILEIRKAKIGNEVYLKICGDFKFKKRFALAYTESKGLLYKNDEFYFIDAKTSLAKTLSRNTLVYHTPISVRTAELGYWFGGECRETFKPNATKRCLIIRYFSFKDIEQFKQPLSKFDLKSAIDESPATYLAMASAPVKHFVEYALCQNQDTPDVVGKLRVLVGKENKEIVSLSSSLEAPKLLYDPNQRAFSVLDSSGIPVVDVYAVRMSSIGFLAVTEYPDLKLLSSEDLSVGIPNHHMISVKNFLIKVSNSKPNYAFTIKQPLRTKFIKFQMQGHILFKIANFLNNGDKLDENCPLAIEYETNMDPFSEPRYIKPIVFEYEAHEMQKICTDDSKLWAEPVEGATGQVDYFDPDKFIKLKYLEGESES